MHDLTQPRMLFRKRGSTRNQHITPRQSALFLALSLSLSGASAATINVGPSCNLINAIKSAETNTSVGGCTAGSGASDTINLENGNDYLLDHIESSNNGDSALPTITSTITIEGNSAAFNKGGILDFRFIYISGSGNLTLKNLTLTGSQATGGSGAAGDGGAILMRGGSLTLDGCAIHHTTASVRGGAISADSGTLTITNSHFYNNNAFNGGAIYNNGNHLSISNSTITTNTATNIGGGILVSSSSTVAIDNTTLSSNTAATGGGLSSTGLFLPPTTIAISNSRITNNVASGANQSGGGIDNKSFSVINITGSIISGNSSAHGGGLSNNSSSGSSLSITNSTISGNSAASSGGALFAGSGVVTLTNATVSDNTAPVTYGSIHNDAATLTLANSIIANSKTSGGAGTDCKGTLLDTGHNWFEDNSCGRTGNGDPKLGPLADNGGPSKTHALLAGSGAIDAAGECKLVTDQRGQPRSACKCDIGAYEKTETSPDNESCKASFFVIPLSGGKTVIFGL